MTKTVQIKNVILGDGIPKICAPLTGKTEEMLKEEAQEAVKAEAELVEWRADCFEDLHEKEKVSQMLNVLDDILGQIPLLFTIRTTKEGGNREISTEDYVKYNLYAAKTGKVSLVDVEFFSDTEEKKSLVQALQKTGVKVIASFHDFEKTEDKEALKERFHALAESGADILKIAEMPEDFDDTAALMQTTKAVSQELSNPLIAISMGNIGAISRISGENFGSCLTFGTVGKASAPGQFAVRELRMMVEALHEKNKE